MCCAWGVKWQQYVTCKVSLLNLLKLTFHLTSSVWRMGKLGSDHWGPTKESPENPEVAQYFNESQQKVSVEAYEELEAHISAEELYVLLQSLGSSMDPRNRWITCWCLGDLLTCNCCTLVDWIRAATSELQKDLRPPFCPQTRNYATVFGFCFGLIAKI